MTRNRAVGFACLAGFLLCVPLANAAIQGDLGIGTEAFPGGPYLVTIGPWSAPAGVVFVGASFSLRDFSQQLLGRSGKWWTLGAIAVGAVLSYQIAPSVAWASAAAFFFGEACDWLCWTPLAESGRYTAGLVLSNTVGSAVDTLIFLWLAFSSLAFFVDTFMLKFLMIAPALLVVVPLRVRARRRAFA